MKNRVLTWITVLAAIVCYACNAVAGSAVNLIIMPGATFQHEFIWQDSSTGAAINLTGWTARMQIRERIDSEEAVVNLSSTTSGITITPGLGKILIEISATATAALSLRSGVYDLELEETASGYVERLAWGRVTIIGEVTR